MPRGKKHGPAEIGTGTVSWHFLFFLCFRSNLCCRFVTRGEIGGVALNSKLYQRYWSIS
jgi:hypothetical protein